MKKSTLNIMLALAFSASTFATFSVHAAVVNNGDILTITSGVPAFDNSGNTTNVSFGSWFSFDTASPDSIIQPTEKHDIGQGSKGIVIGTAQAAGEIDAAWTFGPSDGQHYTTSGISGDTINGLNMSGWAFNWGGELDLMGSGAWNPLNCLDAGVNCSNINGIGKFTWDGVYGHNYTLEYAATTPSNGNTLGQQKYFLHLTGTVVASPVPIPAAVWLFGSGLLGFVKWTP